METVQIHDELRAFLGEGAVAEGVGALLGIQEVVEKLPHSGIEAIIPDRRPFLVLDKALIVRNARGNLCALSISTISEHECAGHVPEQPMIPLIIFSRAIALTGRLLSAYATDREKVVAEVVRTGAVESLLKLADLWHARPPATLLSMAELVSGDRRTLTCDTCCWLITDRLVPAGKIDRLAYAIIPKRVFLASLRSGG